MCGEIPANCYPKTVSINFMEDRILNTLINETCKLGEILIFKELLENDFDKFEKLVSQIIDEVLLKKPSGAILQSCILIKETKLEDFELNFSGKLKYFLLSKFTGGEIFVKNTRRQIVARYVLEINSNLPMLKI
jgi:hypothetical protein